MPEATGSVLAFDFGGKRIGVALGIQLGAGRQGPARTLTTVDSESSDARFAAIARDVIPNALRAAGAEVDVVDAYQNVLPEVAPGLLLKAVANRIDAVTFTSSSSATPASSAASAR